MKRIRQMRRRNLLLILLLLVSVTFIPILYIGIQWREMLRHDKAIMIIRDCGGVVDYESPGIRKSTSWLCYLFGPEWEYRTAVIIVGQSTDFTTPGIDPDLQMEQLHNLRNLDDIYIIGNISNDHLKYMQDFHAVKSLTLKRTQVSGQGMRYLKEMKNLRTLRLLDSHLSDVDLQQIRDIDFLECLYLNNTDVTDEGLRYLKCFTQLKKLSLIGTKINGVGFADLDKLPLLEEIVATGTLFNDEGLWYLQQYPRLSDVYLQDTKITDAGLKHLQNMQSIEYMQLSGTNISDTGLYYLRKLSNLKILIVRGTNVTKEGAEELRKILPGAHIAWGDAYESNRKLPDSVRIPHPDSGGPEKGISKAPVKTGKGT